MGDFIGILLQKEEPPNRHSGAFKRKERSGRDRRAEGAARAEAARVYWLAGTT
jgi:hypothetical protein